MPFFRLQTIFSHSDNIEIQYPKPQASSNTSKHISLPVGQKARLNLIPPNISLVPLVIIHTID